MSCVRALAIVLTVVVAASVPGCGAAHYQVTDDRRGDVNGRSFELVDTKADGTEWSFRARGNSLWVGFVRDEEIGELGELELTRIETQRLWELIENVDLGGRKRGRADRKRGTITLRLREPDGEGGHDLKTVLVPRKTRDDDLIALEDYLAELVKAHKQVEPAF